MSEGGERVVVGVKEKKHANSEGNPWSAFSTGGWAQEGGDQEAQKHQWEHQWEHQCVSFHFYIHTL